MLAALYAKALDLAKGLQRRFEGWRSRPYLCPARVATIGYGATAYPDGRKVTLADPPLSVAEGEALLDHDSGVYLSLAVKLSPRLATSAERTAAIGDFLFNLGGARYRASTLKRRIDEGDWPAAAAQLKRWVYGDGRKLPGLVLRRQAEAVMLLSAGATAAGAPVAKAAPAPPVPMPATIDRAALVAALRRAKAAGGDPYEALIAALGG